MVDLDQILEGNLKTNTFGSREANLGELTENVDFLNAKTNFLLIIFFKNPPAKDSTGPHSPADVSYKVTDFSSSWSHLENFSYGGWGGARKGESKESDK